MKDSEKSVLQKNNSFLSSTQDVPAEIQVEDGSGAYNYEMMASMEESEAFSGSLPSPKILKGYAEIIPDAPERIIRMAEKQMEHDIEMDKVNAKIAEKNIDRGFDAAKRGQILAFVLALILIGCGVYLTVTGFANVGLVIFGTTLVAVIGSFLSSFIKKDKK